MKCGRFDGFGKLKFEVKRSRWTPNTPLPTTYVQKCRLMSHRGVARISRRWGSKSLVPTKKVGLKSLHYVRTRLWRLRYANR